MTSIHESAMSSATENTDRLYGHLQRLGVRARVVGKGPSLRQRGNRFFGAEGHGFIEIDDSPIRWVDVAFWSRVIEIDDDAEHCVVRYAVVDPRLQPTVRKVDILLIRLRSFPLFGKVTDLRWKGNDSGLGIVHRLNSDRRTKAAIMRNLGVFGAMPTRPNPISISAYAPRNVWLISTPYPWEIIYPSPQQSAPVWPKLSKELWDAYQAIARKLLGTSIRPNSSEIRAASPSPEYIIWIGTANVAEVSTSCPHERSECSLPHAVPGR